jgi:hypothetical protein
MLTQRIMVNLVPVSVAALTGIFFNNIDQAKQTI